MRVFLALFFLGKSFRGGGTGEEPFTTDLSQAPNHDFASAAEHRRFPLENRQSCTGPTPYSPPVNREGDASFLLKFCFSASIYVIAQKRMTKRGLMYSYLVCTSCLQSAFHQCHVWETLQYSPVCDGFFGIGVFSYIPHTINRTISSVTSQGAFYRA